MVSLAPDVRARLHRTCGDSLNNTIDVSGWVVGVIFFGVVGVIFFG